MSFIEELKRRNVFRVAVAYLVSAWVALQLADIVLESIEAPNWVIQAFMLAIGLGFLPALVFAWAFELTPDGIKKEKHVDRSKSITHETGQRMNRGIIVALTIAVALLLFDRFVPLGEEQSASSETPAVAAVSPTDKSIAVLPFVNMSSDTEQEYFSDGISEEILNSLARVKDLKVAGRTSSFAFKGQNQDLRQIGETLGVEHILEGSVRKSGTKVRITAQLIQVEDGFHLWSDTYDRELTDVFAIQDEISQAILEQLKAHLLEDGAHESVAATRTDSEAFDLYLLARQRMYERMQKPLESATELLDRVTEIDPDYAPAYAQRGIATLLLADNSYGDLPVPQAESQAKLYLEQALRLDPELAEGWAGMGLYHYGRPGELAQGIEALEKALAFNPNMVDAANWLNNAYVQANRPADALAILEGVVKRDPLYRPGFANLVWLYSIMGQTDKAIALVEKTRPFMSTEPTMGLVDSIISYSRGDVADSLVHAEKSLAVQPNDRVYRIFYSAGLGGTAQNELLSTEGYRGWKVLGLTRLGRVEEAALLGADLAAEGDVLTWFRFLNITDRSDELIDYLESRWEDLERFETDFPSDGFFGHEVMIEIALAYRRAGDEDRFGDAMARIRIAHDSLLAQGLSHPNFWISEASYHALAGNMSATLELLAAAVDGGFIASPRITNDYPVFNDLEGDPEYEAIQARMAEHLKAERAELGLDTATA
jgi:TolB-like protein